MTHATVKQIKEQLFREVMRLRKMLGIATAVILIAACTLSAQSTTTYALPNSSCTVAGSNYLWCSSMGNITINGTVYSVYLSGVNINSATLAPSGSFNLQNVHTGLTTTMLPVTGTYEQGHITANFSGTFNGHIDVELVRVVPSPCLRYCNPRWIAESVVLALE